MIRAWSSSRATIAIGGLAAVLSIQGVRAQTPEGEQAETPRSIAEATSGFEHLAGFVDLFWDSRGGRLFLEVDTLDSDLLYIEWLSSGLGSNDIGLDRGQLGRSHLARFERVGPKVLLVQQNMRFRALSDNPDERRAVADAFARSVLWGFEVAAEDDDGTVLVDATDFVLRDAHGVVTRLQQRGQGSYQLDGSRSAIHRPGVAAFPRNSELEGTLTFTLRSSDRGPGAWVRQVAPSPEAITVRIRHSFVALPEPGYEPRRAEPRSGFNSSGYLDYATPIDQPLEASFIDRHRLKKRDPNAERSEPVEPIVYYLDRGAPEPIRSALLDGARWWNEAFEAAGYIDAFRVELMPEGADLLDVRYNVIQWVHRSTRGWSYGGSVTDPRTGEIMKGHVTLGSLRVRQDFLIAQGLLSPYENEDSSTEALTEMALARLRQLSAHEVGHAIGLMHNFAASASGPEGRESVMDYPHPLARLREDGTIDLSAAYDVGVGEWDKRTVLYGYADFPDGADEAAELDAILRGTAAAGLHYISDEDARPAGGAHPLAHLWDNGRSAAEELRRLLSVRRAAFAQFSERSIRVGAPLSELEDVLTPLYLLHRYQIEAAAKIVAGVDYSYAVRGDGRAPATLLPPAMQFDALDALLQTVDPAELTLPQRILDLIPPPPPGRSRGREHLPSRAGLTFDPVGAAEMAADLTFAMVFDGERAARLVDHRARDEGQPGLAAVIDRVLASTWRADPSPGLAGEVGRAIDFAALRRLMALAAGVPVSMPPNFDWPVVPARSGSFQVRAETRSALSALGRWLEENPGGTDEPAERAHRTYGGWLIERFLEDPGSVELPAPLRSPDGSPIGCGVGHSGESLPAFVLPQ
ncbi:MAG: zinc-dependent metalloprotease [Acidobacteria bacterium]|nr:zinc-dependent metalloprotease [Acidobacteriota bacterium]